MIDHPRKVCTVASILHVQEMQMTQLTAFSNWRSMNDRDWTNHSCKKNYINMKYLIFKKYQSAWTQTFSKNTLKKERKEITCSSFDKITCVYAKCKKKNSLEQKKLMEWSKQWPN